MAEMDNFNLGLVTNMVTCATATATVTSNAIDLADFASVKVCVLYGASGDTLSGSVYMAAKLTECDTADGTYTDVAAGDVIGNTANAFAVCNAAADDDALYCLGYSGECRYLKCVVTFTGTHTYGTPVAIFAVKDDARINPQSQAVGAT